MTKKIYQADNDTPCEPPADIWYEPLDGREPKYERSRGVAALDARPAARKKGIGRCTNTVAIEGRSSPPANVIVDKKGWVWSEG